MPARERRDVALVKLPKPFVNAVNAYARRPQTARFITNGPIDRDHRAGSFESSRSKPFVILNVSRKLITKEARGTNERIGISQSLQKQIAQAGAHGIAHEQSACKHGDRRGYTEDHGQIGAPIIGKVSFDELNGLHYFLPRSRG